VQQRTAEAVLRITVRLHPHLRALRQQLLGARSRLLPEALLLGVHLRGVHEQHAHPGRLGIQRPDASAAQQHRVAVDHAHDAGLLGTCGHGQPGGGRCGYRRRATGQQQSAGQQERAHDTSLPAGAGGSARLGPLSRMLRNSTRRSAGCHHADTPFLWSRFVRRSLAVLCTATLGLTGLGVAAPAGAAPAPQASSSAAAAVPDELLVGYEAGATTAERERARSRASAQRQERVVAAGADRTEVELVRIPQGKDREQAIAELESDPAVAYAEPNWILQHQATSTDPYLTNGSLWGMAGDASAPANQYGSQAAEAWAVGNTGSAAVFVGVIDEGIQLDHPDLAGQVWTNPYDRVDGIDNDGNGYIDDKNGWDFDGNNNTIYDGGTRGSLDDHGTHVAGTIGAKANGAGVVGVNWNVTMISGKFLGRRGGTAANSIKAVDYFTDLKTRHGLNIVATNNSWGGGGFSTALRDAIARANDANILFVAAAGNSGTNNDVTASYPSGYDVPNVLAVAAIDKGGALASFSQFGLKSVDIGAPGVDIWSTTAFNGYSTYNGTSMATPHVTGAAALYAASHADWTASLVKGAILGSAVPTASLSGKDRHRRTAERQRLLAPTTEAAAPRGVAASAVSGAGRQRQVEPQPLAARCRLGAPAVGEPLHEQQAAAALALPLRRLGQGRQPRAAVLHLDVQQPVDERRAQQDRPIRRMPHSVSDHLADEQLGRLDVVAGRREQIADGGPRGGGRLRHRGKPAAHVPLDLERVEKQGEQGGVVVLVLVAPHRVQHEVAGGVGGADRTGQASDQPVESRLHRVAAGLDEPVGVEQHHRTGIEDHHLLAELRATHAERQPGVQLDQPCAPLGRDHHRRWVPR
jgi:subtilisin family serine protease